MSMNVRPQSSKWSPSRQLSPAAAMPSPTHHRRSKRLKSRTRLNPISFKRATVKSSISTASTSRVLKRNLAPTVTRDHVTSSEDDATQIEPIDPQLSDLMEVDEKLYDTIHVRGSRNMGEQASSKGSDPTDIEGEQKVQAKVECSTVAFGTRHTKAQAGNTTKFKGNVGSIESKDAEIAVFKTVAGAQMEQVVCKGNRKTEGSVDNQTTHLGVSKKPDEMGISQIENPTSSCSSPKGNDAQDGKRGIKKVETIKYDTETDVDFDEGTNCFIDRVQTVPGIVILTTRSYPHVATGRKLTYYCHLDKYLDFMNYTKNIWDLWMYENLRKHHDSLQTFRKTIFHKAIGIARAEDGLFKEFHDCEWDGALPLAKAFTKGGISYNELLERDSLRQANIAREMRAVRIALEKELIQEDEEYFASLRNISHATNSVSTGVILNFQWTTRKRNLVSESEKKIESLTSSWVDTSERKLLKMEF